MTPELGSESVSLTTYYPAPSGIYARMVTTGATFMARTAGDVNSYVAIGTIDVLPTNANRRAKVYIVAAERGSVGLGARGSALAIDDGGLGDPELTWRTGGAAAPTIRAYDGIATTAGDYFTGSQANSRIMRSESGTIHFGGPGGQDPYMTLGRSGNNRKLYLRGQAGGSAFIHISNPNCVVRTGTSGAGAGPANCRTVCVGANTYATTANGIYTEGITYVPMTVIYSGVYGTAAPVTNARCIDSQFSCCPWFGTQDSDGL
ncbi:MAG: hypothetical protein HY927_14315 [Elusimicrobia bacterium]|nr:hypothetical protein [Elusimicrobiota bacterium]